MKILVIQTAFLGDVVLATALCESLHQAFPQAQIDFLLRKGQEGLLKNHPFLRKIWIWDKKKKWSSLWQISKALRQEHYDQVFNLQRFFASGLFTLACRAKQSSGFDKNPLSRFFSLRYPHRMDQNLHETQRNLSLSQHLGQLPLLRPQLYPSEQDYQALPPRPRPYVCMAPASVWATKQLPPAKWRSLIESMPPNCDVFLVGGPSDAPLCQAIIEGLQHPNLHNLAGKLSLLASAALFEGATMNYVNDSGPMHLCSARNAPVTAFFCSTVPSFGFGPLSENSQICEVPQLSCRPCGLHGHRRCPQGHFRCGNDLELPLAPPNVRPHTPA